MLLFVFFILMGITESLPRTVYLNNQSPSHLYINAARGNSEVISQKFDGNSDIIQLVLYPTDQISNKPQIALVHLLGETSGTLRLVQNDPPIGHTSITGTVMGLTPGKHGFHVHMTANLTRGCLSTGGHYNPFMRDHGSPNSASRHVGDLGNIVANEQGVAFVDIKDTMVTLVGPNSVIGRSIVIHAGEDDLGLGGDEGSRKTGNAGGRVGCGVIGRA